MTPSEEQAFLRGLQEARRVVASHAKSCWNGGLIERSDALSEVLVELDRTLPPTQWIPQPGDWLKVKLLPGEHVCQRIEIIVHFRDEYGHLYQRDLSEMMPAPQRRCSHCSCAGRIDFLGNDNKWYCSPECRSAAR